MLGSKDDIFDKQTKEKRYLIATKNKAITNVIENPEELSEYNAKLNLIEKYISFLRADDDLSILNGCNYVIDLLSYGVVDSKINSDSFISLITSIFIQTSNGQVQACALKLIVKLIQLCSVEIPYDFVEFFISLFPNIPITDIEMFENGISLYKLFIKTLSEFDIDSQFISTYSTAFGTTQTIDSQLLSLFLKKASNLSDTDDDYDNMVISLVNSSRSASESPFALQNAYKISKFVSRLLTFLDHDFLSNDPWIVLQLSQFWNIEEKCDAVLLSIVGDDYPDSIRIEYLTEQACNFFHTILLEGEGVLLCSAIVSASELLENWIFDFSYEELLPRLPSIIYEGSMKERCSAGIFLGSLATANPEMFYESFLNSDIYDDDEHNPANFPQMFGLLLKINNSPMLCNLILGLNDIGDLFWKQNKYHELRETMDKYKITKRIENYSSSNDSKLSACAEIVYLKHCLGYR